MKLWLLRPIDEDGGPWEPWYDKAFGFIVAAETEKEARAYAGAEAGDENREFKDRISDNNVWLAPEFTSCEELAANVSASAGVVLRDFWSA